MVESSSSSRPGAHRPTSNRQHHDVSMHAASSPILNPIVDPTLDPIYDPIPDAISDSVPDPIPKPDLKPKADLESKPRLKPKAKPESKLEPDLTTTAPTSPPEPSFSEFSYRNASFFLSNAISTGRLGTGRPESNVVDGSLVVMVLNNLPWTFIFLELLWSSIITLIAYGLKKDRSQQFTPEFWISRLNVPISVAYSVGWTLFVLLALFMYEASNRYQKGQFALHSVGTLLRQVIRILRQGYQTGFWHPGDTDRIVAHIVAYPIALKMTLRNEREAAQLHNILEPDDIQDVINADLMHIHCSRVVRAYFSVSEFGVGQASANNNLPPSIFPASSTVITFPSSTSSSSTPPESHSTSSHCTGNGTRFFVVDILDAVDMAANSAVQISEFRSAVGYVNHLRILLCIWLMFLPLTLLPSSGWYTILWSVVVGYCVTMFYVVGNALNEPYGYDGQDIKLNRLCAEYAHDCLADYASAKFKLTQLIVADRDTPPWLEEDMTESSEEPGEESAQHRILSKLGSIYSKLRFPPMSPLSSLAFVIYTLWCAGVVLVTWGLTRHDPRGSNVRWWSFYIPINSATLAYISLAVFFLFSYWVNDAYSRYSRGLKIWLTQIRPNIEQVVFQIAISCKKGIWHQRDRERILSHLAALPYAAKLSLRDSKDLSELRNILAPGDAYALTEAPRLDLHVLNVLFSYIQSADSQDPETFSAKVSPFPAAVYNILYSLWGAEKAIIECHGIRRYPQSPAFTAQMKVFVFVWLAILPLTIVLFNGFLSFLVLLPIGFSIINLLNMTLVISDPFGWDEDDIPLDTICEDMKHTIHKIYHDTLGGGTAYVHSSDYTREQFKPDLAMSVEMSVPSEESQISDQKAKNDSDVVLNGNSADDPDEPSMSREAVSSSKTRRGSGRLRLMFGQILSAFIITKSAIIFSVKWIRSFIEYARQDPQALASEQHISPTFRGSIINLIRSIPSVSPISLFIAIVWAIIATLVSWGLSKLWGADDGRQAGCSKWCSPVDLDPVLSVNVGLALIFLLASRASDAAIRYKDGAVLIYDMELQLRVLATEIVQSFRDASFHPGDKERIIAHLVQVPLYFRDMLYGITRTLPEEKEGLLSEEDQVRFEESASPINHLLQTIEAYFLTLKSSDQEELAENVIKNPRTITFAIIGRLSILREMISRAMSVKRYPVVKTFRKTQRFLTGIWIAILPFSLTPEAGFMTLLWAPILSYGILALEGIGAQLVDPYGKDTIDLPVNKLCTHAANAILEAVHSTKWECDYHTQPSPCDTDARLGCNIVGLNVRSEYRLARIVHDTESVDFGHGTELQFSGPRSPKVKPTFYGHILQSTPWWVLIAATAWTSFACVISYAAKMNTNKPTRWWISEISLQRSVAANLSIAAFTLLGFFASESLNRYNKATKLVNNDLRASCHSLTSLFLSLAPRGFIHSNDHDRIIGHIASIPLVLKAELRNSRDIRDIKGLLSFADVARMQCAESMIMHCIDVIRSYLYKVLRQEANFEGTFSRPKNRLAFIIEEIKSVERLIRSAMFLRTFAIAPGFVNLLKTLLILFFALVPFVYAEVSGWLTIIWLFLMAYTVLGMFSVASELENPFGDQFNDLDLDKISDSIVSDILFVYKHQCHGWDVHIKAIKAPVAWLDASEEEVQRVSKPLFSDHDKMKWKELAKELFSMGQKVMPVQLVIATLAWTLLCVGAAYGVNKHLPFNSEREPPYCQTWFCSRISIDDSLKQYFGFALLLLLGYRLSSSHNRYTEALRIWQDDLIGTVRVFTNRLCQAYSPGTWHEGDIARICGHVAAFAVCLMSTVRKEDFSERLRQLVGEEDVQRMLWSRSPTYHCIDVLRAYLVEGENTDDVKIVGGKDASCGSNEHWMLLHYVGKLSSLAVECEGMVRMPQPYGYVQQLRIFIFIWVAMLPLGLVEVTGWLTLLWILPIVYAVLGVEYWAEQLADPFGKDVSDIPLEQLVDKVVAAVRINVNLFRGGARTVIHTDRGGFPVDPDANLIPVTEV